MGRLAREPGTAARNGAARTLAPFSHDSAACQVSLRGFRQCSHPAPSSRIRVRRHGIQATHLRRPCGPLLGEVANSLHRQPSTRNADPRGLVSVEAGVAAAHLLPALGMFGVLTVMSIAAIFVESWRTPTLLFALGSITAFIVLWLVSGVRVREVKRVALVNILLVPIVVAGLVAA